jgi:hypothetical protein
VFGPIDGSNYCFPVALKHGRRSEWMKLAGWAACSVESGWGTRNGILYQTRGQWAVVLGLEAPDIPFVSDLTLHGCSTVRNKNICLSCVIRNSTRNVTICFDCFARPIDSIWDERYPTNARKQFLLCLLIPLHVSASRCHLQGVTVSLFRSYSRLSIKYRNIWYLITYYYHTL